MLWELETIASVIIGGTLLPGGFGRVWRTVVEITALNFVSNAPVPGKFVIGSVLVTRENADKFYFPDSPV